MIKAVIFDFGGVLGSDADEWDTTFQQILPVTGLSNSEISQVFEKFWPELKIGDVDLEVFWDAIYSRSKHLLERGVLEKIYEKSVSIAPEVLRFAIDLKLGGYRIAVLANESKSGMRNKTAKFNLDSIFEKVYCSAFLGIAKPDSKVYKYVLRDMALSPAEVIFIDNLERNITNANELGINGVLYEDISQLRKFFQSFK